ncbi:MAG: hypothetical protein QM783_17325 [Phycisphaerales bacterium]
MHSSSPLERRTLLGAAGLGAIAAMSKAGPIDPPPGPVVPTGRTLDEIYSRIPNVGGADGRIPIAGNVGPILISNPGSYVLTGTIAGVSAANGIQISADHVTLDLNGYAVSSGFNNGNGINVGSGFRGIRIRNGLINGFNTGVFLNGTPGDVIIEDLVIRDAKTSGIVSNNFNARGIVIRRCLIADTGSTTTASDPALTITGIAAPPSGMVIEDCTVSRLFFNGTGTPGFRGIYVNGGGLQIVRRCTVIGESTPLNGVGISLASASAVRRDNTVIGFATAYGGGTDGGGNV